MKNLLTIVALSFGLVAFPQAVQKRHINSTELDQIFSQWDTSDKAGIAVGVLSDGEIIFTKGYGLANLEHKIPINPETRFHIGDIAKEFTVYALLLLEQRGELSLNDDISKYLPRLESLSQPISIVQLIHHTSGLNNNDIAKALVGYEPEDTFTKKQTYAMIQNQANSLSGIGSEQRHSDAGFMILEDLISKTGKMPYEDFITKEIFEPLAMTSSVFDTKGTVITNKAQGYFAQNDGFASSTFHHGQTILSDVYTTVGDMCLWAKELGDPKIGTEQMVQKFDGLSVINQKIVAKNNLALYTGGHRYWDFRGANKLYHVEVAGGYASKLIRYPEYQLAVVVLGNDGAYNGNAATAASELYIEDFLNPMVNQSTEIDAIKLTENQLAVYEGDYWDPNGYTSRKIYNKNDTLRYYRGPGNESALVPLAKNRFKMITWGNVNVGFNTKESPKKMTITVGENQFDMISYDVNAIWAKDLSVFAGRYYAADLDTSYSLSVEQGKLLLEHPRFEPVQLDPRIFDVFTSNRRHFDSLTFKRDSKGNITGFLLNTQGIAGIWFQKEMAPTRNLTKIN